MTTKAQHKAPDTPRKPAFTEAQHPSPLYLQLIPASAVQNTDYSSLTALKYDSVFERSE